MAQWAELPSPRLRMGASRVPRLWRSALRLAGLQRGTGLGVARTRGLPLLRAGAASTSALGSNRSGRAGPAAGTRRAGPASTEVVGPGGSGGPDGLGGPRRPVRRVSLAGRAGPAVGPVLA
eukprot:4423998-Alexandrium_andersonii.AAC.1